MITKEQLDQLKEMKDHFIKKDPNSPYWGILRILLQDVEQLEAEAQYYWTLLCINGLDKAVPTDWETGKHKRPYPVEAAKQTQNCAVKEQRNDNG